ncbi:hypothetical protein CBL_10816 [Carabus blaptoides fortunei]
MPISSGAVNHSARTLSMISRFVSRNVNTINFYDCCTAKPASRIAALLESRRCYLPGTSSNRPSYGKKIQARCATYYDIKQLTRDHENKLHTSLTMDWMAVQSLLQHRTLLEPKTK